MLQNRRFRTPSAIRPRSSPAFLCHAGDGPHLRLLSAATAATLEAAARGSGAAMHLSAKRRHAAVALPLALLPHRDRLHARKQNKTKQNKTETAVCSW
jgi:hypothetical protein